MEDKEKTLYKLLFCFPVTAEKDDYKDYLATQFTTGHNFWSAFAIPNSRSRCLYSEDLFTTTKFIDITDLNHDCNSGNFIHWYVSF